MYKIFSHGLLGSNTYLVYDEKSLEGMIVDLGNPPGELLKATGALGVKVKYLVLTHAHYDHAEYLSEYKRVYPDAKILAHECEATVMTDPEANVSVYFGRYSNYGIPDKTLREGDIISLGESEYKVISTPGHTPGSICLYSFKDKVILTGDTLFMAGRGRCDFKLGSEEDMRSSLRRLRTLPPDTLVLSGHGAPTTIGDELGRVL